MPVSGRARGLPKNQTPVMYVGPDEPPKPSSESALWLDTRSANIPVASRLISASVKMSATGVPMDGVEDKLPMTAMWDTDGMLASNRLTFHYSGFYHVTFDINYGMPYGGSSGSSWGPGSPHIRKNGSGTVTLVGNAGSPTSEGGTSGDTWLDAGDYLEVWANPIYTGGTGYLLDYTGTLQVTCYTVQESGTITTGQAASAVQAYNSTTQSVATSGYVALTLDSEDWDTDGYHSNTVNPSRLTVPVGRSGLYHITGATIPAYNATGIRQAIVRKNGTTDLAHSGYAPGSASSADICHVDCWAQLSAGDYIELMVWHNVGSNLNWGSATRAIASTFTMVATKTYPDPPSSIEWGRSIGATARSYDYQSVPNITWTNVTFASAPTDTDGFWSAALPTRLTVPANCPSGLYQVNLNVAFSNASATGQRYLRFMRNGVGVFGRTNEDMNAGAPGFPHPALSGPAWLNPGDYVEAQVYQDSGGALNIGANTAWGPDDNNWLSVAYLGSGSAAGTAVEGTNITRSTAQTYTAGQTAAVTFDGAVQNQGNWWAVSPNPTRITVPTTGWYTYEGSGEFAVPTTAGRPMYLYARKGGTTNLGQIESTAGLASYSTYLGCSGVVYLTAGDYVELIAMNNDTASKDLTSAKLRLVKMAAGADTTYAAPVITDTPSAQVYNNAFQANANTTITLTFNTEVYDTHGFWSSGTPTDFIIPAGQAGRYRVRASIWYAMNSSGVRNLTIQKNGSTVEHSGDQPNSGTNDHPIEIDWEGDLAVGDTIRCQSWQNSGSTLNTGSATVWAANKMSLTRLATGPKGDTGAKGDAFYEQGNIFPVSPTSGQAFYRTDIRGGMLFRWNGVYWLSEQEYTAGFDILGGANADDDRNFLVPLSDMDIFITHWGQAKNVTTNNGSNYWTVRLRSWNGSGVTEIANVSTASHSTGWTTYNADLTHLVDCRSGTRALIIYCSLIKTASPGLLYGAVNVAYRLRAT